MPAMGGSIMKPVFYRVHWQASVINGRQEPAGFADFIQRARANGFVVIRSALGYRIGKPVPHFSGQPVNPVRS